jgi:tRNA G46 methylase TrmB
MKSKYFDWNTQETPEVRYDSHFLYLPTKGKFLHLNREEVEKQCRQFSFLDWVNTNETLNIEICSGFGHWLVEKARLEQGLFVGIEIKYKRATAMLTRILSNPIVKDKCKVICAEAHFALENIMPDQTIDNLYINFPEPWAQKHKLFFDMSFVVTLSHKLKRGGKLFMASDDIVYIKHCAQLLYEARELYDNDLETDYLIDYMEGYGTGAGGFEEALRKKGQHVYYLRYTRN